MTRLLLVLLALAQPLAMAWAQAPSQLVTQEPDSIAPAANLQTQIEYWQTKLQVKIGVAVLNTANGQYWGFQDEQRFPMASTMKMLACAKLLYDADNNRLQLSDKVTIEAADIITYSPMTEPLIGQAISVNDACQMTLTSSDNTAANIVLDAIGGPVALTQFLRAQGDAITRLDRCEPELNQGMPEDVRDTTSPKAVVHTWQQLLTAKVLSESAKAQLTTWLQHNQVANDLLRKTLPQGWLIADRSGAGGYGARGIVAMVWQPEQAPVFISIYLHQTTASMEQRNQAIAAIGDAIFVALQNKSVDESADNNSE
ncbi:class A beta-lactamase [Shewanella sp. SNU WT4]|uniref:class A beta-lactamase n=1 Tax=Shewanella sp. SNU WT4 TaxID=2590015 RepID=UPI00143D2B8F|nr:class A beta-lactamase [Shewanella sp. SNU WT4]